MSRTLEKKNRIENLLYINKKQSIYQTQLFIPDLQSTKQLIDSKTISSTYFIITLTFEIE